MEVCRSIRIVNRLLRKPFGITAYRNVTGTAVKEEVSTELVNTFNRDITLGGVVPVFRRALLFPSRVALQDDFGIYTYAGLYQAASMLCQEIQSQLVGDTERTIAYMAGNDASHIIMQWAIWMSGNIAVPLTSIHPPEMLKYFIQDSLADMALCTQEHEKVLRPLTLELNKPLLVTGRDKELTAQLYQPNTKFISPKVQGLSEVGKPNMWYGDADALIIYTSGTTSKPKGVVWTHKMLATQISALHVAWQYSCQDVVLHALPLHHIHGQLNSMLASLSAGARIRMIGSFASHTVWARLLGLGEREEARVSVFHGVPAMYARLLADHERMFADAKTQQYVKSALATRMRLMCAGSAPLPQSLAEKWEQISGFRLLERYGMSEVGMALSNPYRPVEGRTVGCVGSPLPGVRARIARVEVKGSTTDVTPLVTVTTEEPNTQISLERLGLVTKSHVEDEGYEWAPPIVTTHADTTNAQGELQLKGAAVFTRYWNKMPKVDEDFTRDGWFRTGDSAAYENGKFRILGRTSIDIIKSGGYKISALQVESALLEHPSIADVAVLGVEDNTMGEIVSAVVVLKENCTLTLRDLKTEAGKRLAPYQLPKTMLVIDTMPRNVMGKLDKKEIKKLYEKKMVLETVNAKD